MQRADPGRAPCTREPRVGGQVSAGTDRGNVLILGAIIAGGRSSRFGSDKRAALLGGMPLIEHAAAAIRSRVDRLVVAGAPWGALPMLADRPAPGLGPLGGIAAALAYARDGGFGEVLTIGCDMPTVPPALLDALTARAPAFCANAPIFGFWPASLAGTLERHLATGGDRSIRGWARSIGALPIAAPEPLPNINTPADLAAL